VVGYAVVPRVCGVVAGQDAAREFRETAGGRVGSTAGGPGAADAQVLMSLPTEPFETGRVFTPRVDRYSQITVRTNRYSVPVRLIGKRVRVVLHASHLVVYDQNVKVARHERLIAKAGCRLELDQPRSLIRKPGAFPGAPPPSNRPDRRASSPPSTTPGGPRPARSTARGTAPGHLIKVLLLGRHIPHEHLVAGLATALRAGALTADAVALEAGKAAQAEDEPPVTGPGQTPGNVTFLHEWRLAHLPPDTRPLPSVTPYDQLLRRRRTTGDAHREEEAQ
jgi:hypothetical protein